MSGRQFKPLLAYTVQDLFKIQFPVICSSKIDGIRCIVSMEQREEFWKIKENLIGKKVKVKYMSFGIKDLPRHPVFLGFRSDDDQ